MFEMLKNTFPQGLLDSFGDKLHASGEESIDAFLEYQTGDFLDIGKAAIAAVMLAFERDTAIYEDFIEKRLLTDFIKEREKDGTENSWYQLLWKALSAPFDKFGSNQLSVVTFNYDRSLEHYLFTCLKNKYHGKDDSEYKKLICPIVHIHGSLGPLSWQAPLLPKSSVPYDLMYKTDANQKKRVNAFQIARKKIKVIPESKDDTPKLAMAREWINDSERLIFLGFGYHKTNMERLKIGELVDRKTEIKGTTYGLSLDRYQYARSLFANCMGMGIVDTENYTLFDTNVYTFLYDKIVLTS